MGESLGLVLVPEGIEEPEAGRRAARARLPPRPGLPVRQARPGLRAHGYRRLGLARSSEWRNAPFGGPGRAAVRAMCVAPLAARADVVDDRPVVVATKDGTLHLFVRGSDGALLHRTATNGAWGAWTAVGGLEATSGPSALVVGTTIQLYARWPGQRDLAERARRRVVARLGVARRRLRERADRFAALLQRRRRRLRPWNRQPPLLPPDRCRHHRLGLTRRQRDRRPRRGPDLQPDLHHPGAHPQRARHAAPRPHERHSAHVRRRRRQLHRRARRPHRPRRQTASTSTPS